jgi:hypothetical protein
LTGAAGGTHQNEVLASGVSDDGDSVSARATAIVVIAGPMTGIPVPTIGTLGLLLLLLLIPWIGYRSIISIRAGKA